MSLMNKALVDIPNDSGVHVKSAGAKGEKYVYKYVKYFRNEDGQPRNRAKVIGKHDARTGKMFPNKNYFDLYNVDQSLPDICVWDYGYSYLISKACNDIGLFKCLVHAFGNQRAKDIIVMAAFMIREGGVMDGIDDWQQRNYFPGYDRLLTSQSTSRIFTSLSAGSMNKFFINWVMTAMSEGSVCYDVTSISSYSREMSSVEHGYNRDGEDLAQFNLGLFCDELARIPLYYNRYNGSLTDKTNLSYVLANANEVGIRRIKLVLDGGFFDSHCFVNLHEFCDSFTVGMPLYLKDAQKILIEHGANIEQYVNELERPHENTYCKSVDLVIEGVAGKALLFFDALNHVHLCNELSDYINRLKSELTALKRFPTSKLKRYSPYFTLTHHENDNGFDFAIDIDKVEKLRRSKGYFMIFTTDPTPRPEDVLYHYRAKDAAEKMFAQIKCDMDGNRIRTHNEQTTEGKTFVMFIACVIRSHMLKKLSQYLADNSVSLKKVFNQLSNITILSSAKGFRFTKALTKKQKQILATFDAADDIVGSLASFCLR